MAFDAGTEQAIDASANAAADAMRDRIITALAAAHPDAAAYLRSVLFPQESFPNPKHADRPPRWRHDDRDALTTDAEADHAAVTA
jgi:hypothetical protein